jgi:hypothetical protein
MIVSLSVTRNEGAGTFYNSNDFNTLWRVILRENIVMLIRAIVYLCVLKFGRVMTIFVICRSTAFYSPLSLSLFNFIRYVHCSVKVLMKSYNLMMTYCIT